MDATGTLRAIERSEGHRAAFIHSFILLDTHLRAPRPHPGKSAHCTVCGGATVERNAGVDCHCAPRRDHERDAVCGDAEQRRERRLEASLGGGELEMSM